MLISSIKYALKSIKNNLKTLYERSQNTELSNRIVYDLEPLVNTTRYVIDLIERNGIPKFDIEEVHKTTNVSSSYLNNLTLELKNIMDVSNDLIDELTDKANNIYNDFTDKYNKIEPTIRKLETSVKELESSTLEKITNKAIFNHEIKDIDFDKNVITKDVEVVNNTLILPVESFVQVIPSDYTFVINGPEEAKNRLDRAINATNNFSDSETIIGTYFGNIIGKIDGSEPFISQQEINLNTLYMKTIKESIPINYYTNIKSDDYLDVSVKNVFNSPEIINFVSVDSNVDPSISAVENENVTNIDTKNNTFIKRMKPSSIDLGFRQEKPTTLKYQGIDLYHETDLVERYNYFSSLKYKQPDVIRRLNSKIKTSKIEPGTNQKTKVSNRKGFLKYNININRINIRKNTYRTSGQWISDLITTENLVQAIELEADTYIPDNVIEYIKYYISLNNKDWYTIKPSNTGVTKFNMNKKTRILLSDSIQKDNKSLYLGNINNILGVYIRIDMETNESDKSPAIYNLKVKLKVDEDEQ